MKLRRGDGWIRTSYILVIGTAVPPLPVLSVASRRNWENIHMSNNPNSFRLPLNVAGQG